MPLIDRLTSDTSPDYITIDTIKKWIRVEHTLDDDLLLMLRQVAVNEAWNYTQNDFQTTNDAGELVDVPIPFNVVMACLMYIAYLYENRGELSFTQGTGVPLPISYLTLLNPYKKLVGT